MKTSEIVDFRQRRNEYKKSLNRKNIDCTEVMNQLQEIQVIAKKQSTQSPQVVEPDIIESFQPQKLDSEIKKKESIQQKPFIIFEDRVDQLNQNFERFMNTQCRVQNYNPPEIISIQSSEILDSSQISAANNQPLISQEPDSGKISCVSIKSLKSIGSVHSIKYLESQLQRRSLDANNTPTPMIQERIYEKQALKPDSNLSKLIYLIFFFLAVFFSLFLLFFYQKKAKQ